MSGFVAEMTVFVGSWENPDIFYRIATIAACASIVVTAVYILRAVGKVINGPLVNDNHQNLTDAGWYEKIAVSVLIIGILIIGIAPFWLFDLLNPGTEILMKNIGRFVLNP